MRENTPPHQVDFENEDLEEIRFDDDVPPDDEFDDVDELEEVTLEQMEATFGRIPDSDEEFSGVMGPVKDDALVTFEKHKDPVFSATLHSQRPIAVTGGEDDCVYMWSTQTGELMHEIPGHKDTVTEVHFSYDGNYLASGDMSGELLVHKLLDGETSGSITLRKVWEYSMGDMAWMCWHRGANVLLAGSENGEVYIWRIPSGDCKILAGEGGRCGAAALTHDGKKLFAAYSNGVIKLWDLKSCTAIYEVDSQHPMAPQKSVTAVACDRESPLYAAGGEDGCILFCSNNGPVGTVQAKGPVECVAFPPTSDMKIVASGTLHGQLAIWDYSKYSMRTLCEHSELDGGITRLKWISDYTLLVATVQGCIFSYDVRTGLRKFSLSGHLADIYEVCYDPRENILLTVSEDCKAKIFQVPQLGD